VHVDGLLGDEQPPGDLAVGQALGQDAEHLAFADGQRVQGVGRRRGGG
jgi:hypothetical protein